MYEGGHAVRVTLPDVGVTGGVSSSVGDTRASGSLCSWTEANLNINSSPHSNTFCLNPNRLLRYKITKLIRAYFFVFYLLFTLTPQESCKLLPTIIHKIKVNNLKYNNNYKCVPCFIIIEKYAVFMGFYQSL